MKMAEVRDSLGGEWIKEPQVLHPPIWSKNLEEGWRDGPVH